MQATLAGDDRVAEQLEREDRLARAPLDEGEHGEQDRRAAERADDCRSPQGYSRAAPDEPEQERGRPAGEQPAPSQSIECSARSARRGIVSEITTSARPPTGRLTRKTQRQSCCRR